MAEKNDSKRSVSRRRQWISGTNGVIVVAATIAIAFVANAIVSQFSRYRIDMTEDKLYTLSEASKDVVRDLEEPITIKAFISADMPRPMHTLRRRVEDLLVEYRAASGKKLDVQIYSPGQEKLTDEEQKKIESDAKGYGCKKSSIGRASEDKRVLQRVYKCIAFIQGGGGEDKTHVLEDLEVQGNPFQANFEYKFTKALMNLIETEARRVGFVTGFGGVADQRGFSRQMNQLFEQQFGELIKPTTVDLSTQSEVPDNISALVIMNPAEEFSAEAKFALDQFLQRGGSIGWYQSATGVDQRMQGRRGHQGGMRRPLEPGLHDFFAEYGLELRKDLVLDREHAAEGFVQVEGGIARVSFPATFITSNIDKSVPFTKGFGAIGLPAPSSINVKAAAVDNEEIDVHEVIRSHDSAVRRPEASTDLSYASLNEATEDEEPGPFVLAAALQGNLPSYYENNAPPSGVDSEEVTTDSSMASRLLVIGNGTFYRPDQSLTYGRQLAGLGGRLLISSIEWLVQDSALAQIRGKSMPRLVSDIPAEKRRTIQFVNIACVPAVFALIGVVMMFRRRRRRSKLRWEDDQT